MKWQFIWWNDKDDEHHLNCGHFLIDIQTTYRYGKCNPKSCIFWVCFMGKRDLLYTSNLSFIQTKSPKISCNLKLLILVDLTPGFDSDTIMNYSHSRQVRWINHNHIRGGSCFYVGRMRGMFKYDNSFLPIFHLSLPSQGQLEISLMLQILVKAQGK